ncbi:hypothetical protein Taro_040000 [Colocasia esculenta]|uniref:Uncharacterized protein n=1 Tax=Colocasia esculenta TaxID=4460 RepID=A0A843WAR6_COLES|nr:hypothetical protein [Colocasia esculenta]
MFSLHWLVMDVLGLWTACSRALELRGGGVQAYEKALIGWIFVLSFVAFGVLGVALFEHSAEVATGFPVATWSRRIAAGSMFGFLVGAEGLGTGAVTVNMPPRTRKQAREVAKHQEFNSDGSVASEHVPIVAQPQQFEQPGDSLTQGILFPQGGPQQQQQQSFPPPPPPPPAVMEQWWRAMFQGPWQYQQYLQYPQYQPYQPYQQMPAGESWVHELERTFETMDCTELDHVSGESHRLGAGVSVSVAAEWWLREVFFVPEPLGQSRECFLFFFFGDRRCWPDLKGVTVEVQGHQLPARLFALQLHDFDAILSMDCMFSLHRLVKDVLGSGTACSRALELGGGGVQAYEKALIWWILVLRRGTVVRPDYSIVFTLVPHLTPTGGARHGPLVEGETSQQFPPRRTEETVP